MKIQELILETIGPHGRREFELLLSGEKPLAWFDEEEFAPHRRKIAQLVHERDWVIVQHIRDGFMRYIVGQPGSEQRAQEFLKVVSSPEYTKYRPLDAGWQQAHRRAGELLGYSNSDIAEYLELARQRATGLKN